MIIYKNRNIVIPVGLGPNFNNETVEIKNENKSVTITENGTEIVTYDPAEYTGLGIVQINTEVQGGVIQDPVTLDITENGDYDVRPDEDYDGLSEVSVSVNVQPELEAKTVDSSTVSQVVTTHKYGLSSVTVNPYTLDSKTVDSSTVSQTIVSDEDGLSSVTVNPYVLDEKTVDSSTVAQVVTSDEDGLRQVTINPFILSPLEVDSSTANQEYTGHYNSVKVNKYTLDSKTVDSSTVSQIVTSDADGLSSVTVTPYVLDSSSLVIDENGEYAVTSTADGLSRVDVSVNIDTESYYNEGYNAGETAGIAEGIAEQKAKLASTKFTTNGTFTRADGWNEVEVEINTVNNQDKTVDSSVNTQNITPDTGYTGLGTVTVNGVTSSIDSNIVAGNIKDGVTILGVQGTFDGGTLQAKTVDSSTNSQVVIPTDGNYGLSQVTVNPYTLDSSSAVLTENGEYVFTSSEDGLSRVDVSVNIDTSAYYDAGREYQRSLMTSGTFEHSGTYNRYNGWNEVVIDVEEVNNEGPVYKDSSTNAQTVTPDVGYTGLSRVVIYPYNLQAKVAEYTPTTEIVYTPDAGYDGLSQVTVPARRLQARSVDASTNYYEIRPEEGYYGISTVHVQPYRLQSKTVDSSTETQTVTTTSSYYNGLSSVTVNPYVLDSKTVDPSTNSQTITSDADGLSSVTINPYVLDSSTVDASTNQIVVTSAANGLSSVTVNAVTSSIDSNISAGNIKNGVTILGVQGTYGGQTINNQNKTIDSSTNAQSITYDSGYTGLGTVTVRAYTLQNKSVTGILEYVNSDINPGTFTVTPDSSYNGLSEVTGGKIGILSSKTFTPTTSQQSWDAYYDTDELYGLKTVVINAVTSSIDANITAGNIKDGVTILGVQGTYTGTTINNQNKTVDSSTNAQSVTYDSGYTGLGTVTVNAYDIDSCYTLAASI